MNGVAQLCASQLERLLAAYFSDDIEAQARLEKLQGKVLQIDITGFEVSFQVEFLAQTIRLHTGQHLTADAIVRGAPFTLLNTLRQKDSKQLFSGEIQLSGDVELIKKIKRLSDFISFDWAYYLSKFVGEYPASRLQHSVAELSRLGQRNKDALSEELVRYLQDEAQQLPASEQAQSFYASVDQARDQAERLQARLKRLIVMAAK